MRPLRNTERVLNNTATERLLQKEALLGSNITFEDVVDEVVGVYPKVMMEGSVFQTGKPCIPGVYKYAEPDSCKSPLPTGKGLCDILG
jgi:hypothetical protein